MRIMSYNVRVATPRDGEFTWSKRQPAVQSVWRRLNPDFVGIQEGSPSQMTDLQHWFPDYDYVGVGRESDESGEHVAIFYKKAQWNCLQHGNFWLSASPSVPGSRTFGNTLPRHATWARFQAKDGQHWFVINTHFDHKNDHARQQSADLIRSFALDNAGDDPLVITGDFNALPQSEVLHRLLHNNTLRDVFAECGQTDGTFHNYTGQATRRIDYILTDAKPHISHAHIIKDQPLGLWPSDHFPIYADLAYTA